MLFQLHVHGIHALCSVRDGDRVTKVRFWGRKRPETGRAGSGGTRSGQTGGSCTLTTAERPPCTMASAPLSVWGSSAGSDTVTP
jgi:hypothetical protein